MPDNVMKQGTAAQFDVIRVCAEEENPFSEEIHVVICPGRRKLAQETFQTL